MNMASSGSPLISRTVSDCSRAFRKCLSHPELCYFEDQFGRFNLWATNINAASATRSSLDSRLRDSDKTRNMVVQLLRALQVNLEYSVQLIERQDDTPQDDGRSTKQDGNAVSSSDQSDSTSSNSSDSRLSDKKGEKRKLPLEPIVEVVDQVQGIISRLHQLSRAIRNASQQDRALKIAKFEVKNPNDIELCADLKEHVTWLLDHYYPQSDPELRVRLLSGILLRQKQFLYRKSRRKEIRTHSFPLSNVSEAVVAAVPTVAPKPQSVTSRQERTEPQAPRSNAEKSIAQTQNTVSVFDEKLFTPDAAPLRQPAMSVRSTRQDKDLDWPAPPMRQKGTIETECPYCFDILAEDEISDIKLWRYHVKKDLEPYSCYFKGCQDPILTFREFRKWLEHIREVHTPREWLCTVKTHKPCKFSSEQAFRQHMLSEHRDTFTDSQLNMLVWTNSKAASRPFSLCPLCRRFPEDCHTVEDQKSKELPDNLPRHIAGHLKSLAMLSLPPRGDIEGTNEVTMAGDKREVEDSDANSISLTLSDLSIYRTFDIYQVELDMERTWVLPERISPLTELPESEILIDPAWLEQDEYYYDERQDPWGSSALFRFPEYPGGQDKDPRLASFRERALLSAEKFKQQEGEDLLDGTGSVPFQPYIEEGPNSYDSRQSFQSIVLQQPYRKFSPEELRWADYVQGRKFGNASGQAKFFDISLGFGGFGSNNTTSALGTNNTTGIGPTNTGSLSGNKPAPDNDLSSKANVGYCQGTGSVPFRPYVQKELNSYDSRQSFQSIAFQEPYWEFSPEELRWADYVQGRKFGNASC